MTRRAYMYCSVPLFTLLGCGSSFVHMAGALWALILSLLLALPAWGLVWGRLYASGRLRPEFAVLSVLPQLIFFILMYSGQHGASSAFAAPAWQNLYFLLMVAAVAVQIISFRPGLQDEQRRPTQDPPFIFLSVLLIANGVLSWVQYASLLFPIA